MDFVGNSTNNFNLTDYSLSSNIIVKDKVSLYQDTDSIKLGIINITNQFFINLGINYPAQPQVALSQAITGFILLKNFLDNMVVSATFLLLMLSVLLIYSLMIGDVEEKTYEYGMLRALGFKQSWLIVLLIV